MSICISVCNLSCDPPQLPLMHLAAKLLCFMNFVLTKPEVRTFGIGDVILASSSAFWRCRQGVEMIISKIKELLKCLEFFRQQCSFPSKLLSGWVSEKVKIGAMGVFAFVQITEHCQLEIFIISPPPQYFALILYYMHTHRDTAQKMFLSLAHEIHITVLYLPLSLTISLK